MHEITLKTTLSTGLHPKAQKAVAKAQLNRFLDEMPEGTIAYVAGGAPRDWHHGWGCRDLDIFFQVPEEHSDDAALVLDNTYELMKKDDGYYGIDGNEDIISIHEYPIEQYSRSASMKCRKCQLIRVSRHPLQVIHNFPISLSRIWMDKEGSISCDSWYARSYNEQVIFEVNQSQGWNYIYINKILGRFRKYAFVPMHWSGGKEEADHIGKESG
jgi:hypothetical protein